jgi:hypothetical protein
LFCVAWLQMVTSVNYDFSVTILSQRKCSLHAVSIFNAEDVLSRMVMANHDLSRITVYSLFELYTVFMSRFDTT